MEEQTTERGLPDLIAERLFRARTLVISGEINPRLAAIVTAPLLKIIEKSDELTA